MAKLRKFDQYAADFVRDLSRVLERYAENVTVESDAHHEIIRVMLKTGEDVTILFEGSTVLFLYRGKYYSPKELK